MNLDNIQKHLDKVMKDQNYRSIPEFEGYSPFDMEQILHFTFGTNSPIKLKKLSDSDYNMVPILNQIKYLTGLIAEQGEIKLTAKGYLPTKVVAELYQQGFMKDKSIERGISKLYKETDSLTVHLSRLLIELAGLIKKRKGKISLTKSGGITIQDNFQLLKLILETFAVKFNWPYFDGYGENNIGQLGYGFSLILLSKFGNERRLDSFYADKYFKAFPQLLNSLSPTYGTVERYSRTCYSIRTFNRFLSYFGLITQEEIWKGGDSIRYITKTSLFDSLIKVRPHYHGK